MSSIPPYFILKAFSSPLSSHHMIWHDESHICHYGIDIIFSQYILLGKFRQLVLYINIFVLLKIMTTSKVLYCITQ